MRSESSAICTSGEPVSLAARRKSATTPDFFSVARDILGLILQSEINTWIFGREYYRKGSSKHRLSWRSLKQASRLQPTIRQCFRQTQEIAVRTVQAHA